MVAEQILGVWEPGRGSPEQGAAPVDVEAFTISVSLLVDINLQSIAGGVGVTYIVQGEHGVETDHLFRNNSYKDEDLLKVVFTTRHGFQQGLLRTI